MGTIRSGRRRETRKPQSGTKPEPPDNLTEFELDFWAKTIAPANHLTQADLPLCIAAAEFWGLYRASVAIAKADPSDKNARIAVCGYAEKLRGICKDLGLDPLGRERLPTEEIDVVGEALGISTRDRQREAERRYFPNN